MNIIEPYVLLLRAIELLHLETTQAFSIFNETAWVHCNLLCHRWSTGLCRCVCVGLVKTHNGFSHSHPRNLRSSNMINTVVPEAPVMMSLSVIL